MQKSLKKNKRNKRLYLILIIVFLLVASIGVVYNQYQSSEIEVEKTPLLNSSSIPELVLEEVIATEETKFFSEEEEKPLLWYARYKNKLVFFNKGGVHPLTGAELLPVTREIVETFKSEQLEEEKKVSKRVTVIGEIIPSRYAKKKKPKVKKKKRGSIWNYSVENTTNETETSLFVLNKNNTIDVHLTNQFKKEFLKKKYHVTPEVIYYSELNNEIISHLKPYSLDYFKGNFEKHTDYICVATSSYSYNENALRKDMIDCKMVIDYAIYNANTAEIMLSESDKVFGTGLTEKEARVSAVEKFVF